MDLTVSSPASGKRAVLFKVIILIRRLKELNRVLGGGLVKGSVVLLSGDPGIGKSTILLQICECLGNGLKILYVSGEESAHQIKLRASRLGVSTGNLSILCETDAQYISFCQCMNFLFYKLVLHCEHC